MSMLGSLLGYQGYGQADEYQRQAFDNLNKEQDTENVYRNLGRSGLDSYNNYDSQYQQALNDRANYLRQDPYTDQRDAMDLSRATQGTTAAYQRARANLSSGMAQRGYDPGSSMETGGLTGIENAYAGQQANAYNQLAYNQISQRNANQRELLGMEGDASNRYYGMGTGAYNAADSIDGGLYNAYNGAAIDERNRVDANNNAITGALTGLATTAIGAKWKLPKIGAG